MKTSDLCDGLLDKWVAKAEGRLCDFHDMAPPAVSFVTVVDPEVSGWVIWSPSRDWGDGGPIIERERIAIWSSGAAQWHAIVPGPNNGAYSGDEDYIDANSEDSSQGSDPLIAAMRAYVASKFGPEVTDA